MDIEEAPYRCEACKSPVQDYHRFCYKCGAYLGQDAGQIDIFNNRHLRAAILFYVVYLVICLFVSYTDWFAGYDRLFWVELVLAAITITCAAVNWQELKPVFRFNRCSVPVLLGVVVMAVVFSAIVNISVNEINISLFRKDSSLYEPYRAYAFPVPLMFYSIAFIPAVFEEFAFRGVLYNYFSRLLDERLVVIVTACIFAAIHLNFFGLLWLIPFGLLIGNLRRKYQTIWYGVIFHFVFNATACLFDLYRLDVW